ncbi:MAG: hypothetical protein HYX44_12665 [Aquabacterium sp.]|nr:hypothetical protein [Aquabacterium sp.]
MLKRLTLGACSALTLLGSPLLARAQDATAPSLQTRDGYLIVTRVDTRKCAYPLCGGYFVKAVNQALTRCADGSMQKECHAVQLNTNALGWSGDQRAAFDAEFAQGHALVRGLLEPAPAGLYTADQLTISEAWQGQGLRNKPLGSFYGVRSTGIVCITTPCPSLAATKLNVIGPVRNPDLDLSLSGANDKQIQAAYEALGSTGILAAGAIVPVRLPALDGGTRQGSKLLASEFYLPAKP